MAWDVDRHATMNLQRSGIGTMTAGAVLAMSTGLLAGAPASAIAQGTLPDPGKALQDFLSRSAAKRSEAPPLSSVLPVVGSPSEAHHFALVGVVIAGEQQLAVLEDAAGSIAAGRRIARGLPDHRCPGRPCHPRGRRGPADDHTARSVRARPFRPAERGRTRAGERSGAPGPHAGQAAPGRDRGGGCPGQGGARRGDSRPWVPRNAPGAGQMNDRRRGDIARSGRTRPR